MVRELWTLIGVELIDVLVFVLVLLLGDSVSQGLVQSGLVDDVAAAAAEVHGDVAVLVLLVELLELNRCLVVAAEALEALMAATADAVGAGAWRTDRRESEERLWISISWRLLGWRLDRSRILPRLDDTLDLLILRLLSVDGFSLFLSPDQEVGLHTPLGLNRWWLLRRGSGPWGPGGEDTWPLRFRVINYRMGAIRTDPLGTYL